MCKRICELVMAVLMIVLGLLPMAASVHKWLLVFLGVILLVHSFACKRCSCECVMPKTPQKTASKSRKK